MFPSVTTDSSSKSSGGNKETLTTANSLDSHRTLLIATHIYQIGLNDKFAIHFDVNRRNFSISAFTVRKKRDLKIAHMIMRLDDNHLRPRKFLEKNVFSSRKLIFFEFFVFRFSLYFDHLEWNIVRLINRPSWEEVKLL